MAIITRLAPIVGSMVSVEAAVDQIVTVGGTISSQGLPLLFREGGGYSSMLPVKAENLDETKEMIGKAWRHAWCEYQQSPHRGRGRPTAKMAFHFLVHAEGSSLSNEEAHRLFATLLTRMNETRNARFFIYVTHPKPKNLTIHILMHPVDLHGYVLRFENDFPEQFQEALDMIFSSDVRKVTKVWLSS